MPLPSRPMVEEKIRLAVELKAHHEDLAKAAQLSEEIIGDLVLGSEMNTRAFMSVFRQLATLYSSFVELHATGHLHPAPLNSLILQFQHNIAAETENSKNYLALLALEARHDEEHHFHADLASNLELRQIVLLCFRDEILLREQGFTQTPLHDVDLSI